MADPFKAPKAFKEKQLNKSKGILDDFAVRKSMNSREGTITKTPTDDNDIANKKYVDDEIAGIPAPIVYLLRDGSNANANINIDSYSFTTTGTGQFSQVYATDKIGIGVDPSTLATERGLHVEKTGFGGASSDVLVYNKATLDTSAGSSSGKCYTQYNLMYVSHSGTYSTSAYGQYNDIQWWGGSIYSLTGGLNRAYLASSNSILSSVQGLDNQIQFYPNRNPTISSRKIYGSMNRILGAISSPTHNSGTWLIGLGVSSNMNSINLANGNYADIFADGLAGNVNTQVNNAYGLYLGSHAYGTNKWSIYNAGDDVHLGNDNVKTYIGTGQDASIYYDGTDLHIDSQEVGSGHIILDSPKTTTGDPAGVEGKIYWNTIDNVIKMYADGAWRTLASW